MRPAVAALAIAGVAVGVWLVLEDRAGPPEEAPPEATAGTDTAASEPAEPPLPSLPLPPGAPAPALRIAESGRLATTLSALHDGDGYALGLDMPDEARGDGALEVKVADVRGRVIELTGERIDGAGTGLRIDLDPAWLEPGRYLIQVVTAERTPLPLRRYVLEIVLEPPPPDAPADLEADAQAESPINADE